MKKLLSYIFSPIALLLFILLLLIFHVVQVVCNLFSERARQKAVDILNILLLYTFVFVGARIKFKGFKDYPTDRPLIILSNHQSALDIPPIIWGFRKHVPRFVAKKELGKGIPSISYNLVKGKSALIERKNPRQAITEIAKLGKFAEKNKIAISIFPEGTRSKTGKMRKFQHSGIATLLKYAPSALVIPMAVDGNSELIKNGFYPLNWGTKLNYTALEPIEPSEYTAEELTALAEQRIREELGQ